MNDFLSRPFFITQEQSWKTEFSQMQSLLDRMEQVKYLMWRLHDNPPVVFSRLRDPCLSSCELVVCCHTEWWAVNRIVILYVTSGIKADCLKNCITGFSWYWLWSHLDLFWWSFYRCALTYQPFSFVSSYESWYVMLKLKFCKIFSFETQLDWVLLV